MGEIGRVLQYLEGYRETDRSYEALCDDLALELADLLALTFKLASQHGIDMDEAMRAHLQRFVARNGDVEQGRREMSRYVSYQERNIDWVRGQDRT